MTRVRMQPIIALYFEFETVLKFYYLGASFHCEHCQALSIVLTKSFSYWLLTLFTWSESCIHLNLEVVYFAISSKKALSKLLKLLNVDLVLPIFGVVLLKLVMITLLQSMTQVVKYKVFIHKIFEFVNMTFNK